MPEVDYNALAKQHGAIVISPGVVDYEALAKQHGAVSSEAPKQPKQPEQRSFMGSLYDSTIGGLINGVKDYVTNGSPSAQGLRTAARGLELYQKQDKGPLTPAEQEELDNLDLPTPAGYDTPLSQHPVTGNAVRATQQAASGNYAGAAGTMASYPVMAAAGAIIPRIPGAAKAAYKATAEQLGKPGTMQMATGGAELLAAPAALYAGHPIVAGAAAVKGLENVRKGYAARVEAANASPPLYDDIAKGMGGSDFKSLDVHRQGIVKTIAEQIQTKDAAVASSPAQEAPQPLPPAQARPVLPAKSLNQALDEFIASRRAPEPPLIAASARKPVWQGAQPQAVAPEPVPTELPAPALPSGRVPGRFDPNATWQERLAQLGVKQQTQPLASVPPVEAQASAPQVEAPAPQVEAPAPVQQAAAPTPEAPPPYKVGNLKLSDDHLDSHNGQHDFVLWAKDEGITPKPGFENHQYGKAAGSLEYSEYQGKPQISMVRVKQGLERQGVASKLIDRLATKYGGYKNIDWGYLTDDGAKLKEAMDAKYAPTPPLSPDPAQLAPEAQPAPAPTVAAPEPAPAVAEPPKAPPVELPNRVPPKTSNVVSGNEFETAARYSKAQALAKFLYAEGNGVPHADALRMDPSQWQMAQKGAGVAGPPSPKTVALALQELEKLERSQPIARQMAQQVSQP